VIYTADDTPKGVEIEHRRLVDYVRWATREASIDVGTQMPLTAPISSGVAGDAIFLPLLAGGTVHLDLISQAGLAHQGEVQEAWKP
jgi:non-ribosomal peptide synthetase component F